MALLLDIDAHGRVVPQSDELRRALADRAGRFQLLPSAPDLLVARRSPAAGGAAARPRCILAGDLSGFHIADFIAFVHQSRLSGILTVSAEGAERSVAFKDGEVRSAQSSAAGERVGEVAVRLGLVTQAQVAQATQAGVPLGRQLVEKGLLSANDLWKCLHEQVAGVFHAILLSRAGTFFLVDDEVTDRPGTPLAVSTQSLLMDGIRRIDEMSLFRARIPGPEAFLRRREPRRAVTLRPVEQELLALVDGRRTVAAVASAAHLNEFDATKILYHLAEAGYVEALAEAVTSAAPEARLAELAAGMNELYRLVVAAIPEPARPGFLAGVRAFLADGTTPFAPVWAHAGHAPDGALDAATVLGTLGSLQAAALARLEPSGDPARLLLGALRELLFFQLFLAGERLGREADDALAVAVKGRLPALERLVEPA